MAVVNGKSLAITNRDSTPVVISNDAITRGIVKSFVGVCAVAATDQSTSTYRFGQLPSNARLQSMLVSADALGGSCAGTIDIYDTTAAGGAIIATTGTKALNGGISLVSALKNVESLGGGTSAAGLTPAKREKFLWDLLGIAADPNKVYDVVLTLTADAASAGSVAIEVEYV